MNNQGTPRRVGPEHHRTQNFLLSGLKLLRNDVTLPSTLEPAQLSNNPVAQAIGALTLDRAYKDVADVIDRAITQLEPLAGFFGGPNAMDVRFLTMSGGLRSMAESTDLLSEEAMRELGRPNIRGLSDALVAINLAAGSGYRGRAVERLRGLSVVIDGGVVQATGALDLARRAIQGGASALHLRVGSLGGEELMTLARRLVALGRAKGVALIVHDHLALALAVAADGLHLGPGALPTNAVRQLVKPWQIIGRSSDTVDQVTVDADDADYVAVDAAMTASARKALALNTTALIATSGVTAARAGSLARAGADGIAVMSAVARAPDPSVAVAELLAAFRSRTA